MTPGDRLLYAISAKRELGWPSFKKTFEQLCGEHLATDDLRDMAIARYETARGLDALGHIDVDLASSNRLYAAPPTLAVLPTSGLPEAALAGARSPNTLERLRANAETRGDRVKLGVRDQHDKSKRFPARITVAAESHDDLQSLAADSGLGFQRIPVSWRILNFAGSLSEYLESVEWQRGDKLNWEEQQFDPTVLHFVREPSDGRLRLIKHVHPSRQYPLYFLWRDADAARVDPDWGRFAVLGRERKNIILYERSTGALLVPATVPLPKLLARSLCLCSGMVPRIISGATGASPLNIAQYRLYVNVPRDYARILAEKLGQTLITEFTGLETNHD